MDIIVTIIEGPPAPTLIINGVKVAGPDKPLGGMSRSCCFKVDPEKLSEALPRELTTTDLINHIYKGLKEMRGS